MRILFFAATFVFSMFSTPALGATICWVEEVVRADDVMSIRMMKNYKHAVRYIKRKDGTTVQPFEKENDWFELREGDSASISMPHNECTAKGVVRDGVPGVELNASTCMSGMPCSTSKDFVTAR